MIGRLKQLYALLRSRKTQLGLAVRITVAACGAFAIATALGLRPVILPCGLETGFQPTIAMLEALDPKPDGLILASPANPTGSMLSPAVR